MCVASVLRPAINIKCLFLWSNGLPFLAFILTVDASPENLQIKDSLSHCFVFTATALGILQIVTVALLILLVSTSTSQDAVDSPRDTGSSAGSGRLPLIFLSSCPSSLSPFSDVY